MTSKIKIIQPIAQSDPIRVCVPNFRLIRAAVKPAKRHEHTNRQTDKQTNRQTDSIFIYIDIYTAAVISRTYAYTDKFTHSTHINTGYICGNL